MCRYCRGCVKVHSEVCDMMSELLGIKSKGGMVCSYWLLYLPSLLFCDRWDVRLVRCVVL